MLTTCPECRTTFRLSQAQLEARRGLVRCGHCKAVFNAYDTLLPEFEAPAAVEPAPSAGVLEPPAGMPEPVAEYAAPLPPPPEAVAEEATLAPDDEAGPAEDDDAFVLHMSERVEVDLPQFEPPPLMPFGEAAPAAPAADSSDAILLSELPTRAQIEPGRGIGMRLLAGLASLLLVLALCVQAVYFLRGPLVAWLPELRPALAAACAPLGCRVPLASDLAALRVEASSLETDPEQPNRASLRVSFSNRSRLTQQWPYFVLKLTDWQGGALAQRVFRPADYLPAGKAILAGMAPMSEQEFRLDLDLGGLSASGYEVVARYP